MKTATISTEGEDPVMADEKYPNQDDGAFEMFHQAEKNYASKKAMNFAKNYLEGLSEEAAGDTCCQL